MKHHFRERRAVLEGYVQPLGRQKFYSNVLKSALLDRHLIHSCWHDGKRYVRMLRTGLSHTNCGDIKLQFIGASVSSG